MQQDLQEDPHKYSSVNVAARLGDLVGLQELVWHGRPVDVFDNRGWSPLHEAAYHGNTGCLEFLLRHPDIDVDWVTHAKETPLILAARRGHFEAMAVLVTHQADKEFTTNEGYTPLWEALKSGSFACFKSLVKDVDLNARIYTGYTALHLAAENGMLQHVSMLLQYGADPEVYADHGLTPLFLACHKGHLDVVKLILKKAKERGQQRIVNAVAVDNASPLLIAAQEGFDNIVAVLLQNGADTSISSNDDRCVPLQYAVTNGHVRCTELLLAKTNLQPFMTSEWFEFHPLVQGLKHRDTNILKLLCEKFGADAVTGVKKLPAYLQLELGHLSTTLVPAQTGSLLCLIDSDWPINGAQFLLQKGFDPNSKDPETVLPPLLVALWNNNVPLFQLLLRHGAVPNIYHRNVTGNVAMLLAFQKDLERDLTAYIVRNTRQPNFQVFSTWQLFLKGAESHSLFNITDPVHESCTSPAITNLFGLMFHMFHRKENLVPVLALLMCISDHAKLPPHILAHFETTQRKVLQTISEKTDLLSHRCRRVIVQRLGCENRYCRTALEKLGIPTVIQEYLMFSELEPPLQDMILKFITVNPEEDLSALEADNEELTVDDDKSETTEESGRRHSDNSEEMESDS